MGYTTDFEGEFRVTPQLKPEHRVYLQAFADTRRMGRNELASAQRPDPVREAVGLPAGRDGEYFVGAGEPSGQEWNAPDVIDTNKPPPSQPGLWCKWEPNDDGTAIRWSGAEKFYNYTEWLQYLIDNFLEPWGYTLSGVVEYEGEDGDDFGRLTIDPSQKVIKKAGKRVY